MKHKYMISFLLIFISVFSAAAYGDTDTVDTEITAAAKSGPNGIKQLESKAIDTIMNNTDPIAKDHACRILRVIGTEKSIDALGSLLSDEKLASAARNALEAMDYPQVNTVLRENLAKTSGPTKVGIINTIAMRKDAGSTDILIKLLKDKDPDIAAACAWALGRIASDKAVDALYQASQNPDPKVKAAVADGLLSAAEELLAEGQRQKAVKIYSWRTITYSPEHVRMGALAGFIRSQPDLAADILIDLIGKEDVKIKGMAIDMIVNLEGADVTETFSSQFDKLNGPTQVLLLGALVDRGNKQALRPLVTKAVSSRNGEVRILAIKSLGDIGSAGSVSVLAKTIASGNQEEKQLAASSLRRLGGKDINAAIIRELKKQDDPTRVELIEILRDREAKAAVDVLLKAAADNNPDVRKAAFKAVAELAGADKQKDVLDLLVKLKGDDGRNEAERAAIMISNKITDESKRSDAVIAYKNVSAETRSSLLKVLGGIGDEKGLKEVTNALKDKNPEVYDTAVRTLADWPDAAAVDILMDIFNSSTQQRHRIVALRGCIRLISDGGKSADESLKICETLMKGSSRDDEKKLVLACLSKIKDARALRQITPYLSDKSLKAEAQLAVIGVIKGLMGCCPDDAKAGAEMLISKNTDISIKKQAQTLINLIGKFDDYIMAWQISGPYSKPFFTPFETAFGPEDPTADNVVWKDLEINTAGDKPWMFDLLAAIGGTNTAGYARTWIYSDNAQAARIEFGTDDGNKLWINGILLHADGAGGAAVPGEHKVNVNLKKGWNKVLLKVTQDTGPWEFCLKITKPDGSKLQGIKISPTEP